MSGTYHQLVVMKPSATPASTLAPACTAGPVDACTSDQALPQCHHHESGGVQCEREHGHKGKHGMPDSLFSFLQARWGHQGPICRTRRGPPEYIYEEGEMCL